jgi:hypothetical protein
MFIKKILKRDLIIIKNNKNKNFKYIKIKKLMLRNKKYRL